MIDAKEDASPTETGMPLVSVVIPVFNGIRFLEETLESVIGQRYGRLEIVVVDDGSTDGSGDLARSVMRDSGRPHSVLTVPNGGGAAARNRGILEAQGDLIAMLDADDLWHPDKLRKQVLALNRDKDALACGCNYVFFKSPERITSRESRFSWSHEAVQRWLLLEDYGPALNSTLVMRKQKLLEVGLYDESLRFGEDLELGWRIINSGFVVTVPQALTYYRLWSGQIHSDPEQLTEAMQVIYSKFALHNCSMYRRARTNLEVTRGFRLLRQARVGAAFGSFSASIKLDLGRFFVTVYRVARRRLAMTPWFPSQNTHSVDASSRTS